MESAVENINPNQKHVKWAIQTEEFEIPQREEYAEYVDDLWYRKSHIRSFKKDVQKDILQIIIMHPFLTLEEAHYLFKKSGSLIVVPSSKYH